VLVLMPPLSLQPTEAKLIIDALERAIPKVTS
jgi:adenosylmethionine-8-amino-7-oxononanoate aminotransferase